MNYGFIYKTTNKINGKSYIGMCSCKARFKSYLGSGKLLSKAIEKYGKENFDREILEWCKDDDSLREAESKWIEKFDAINSNRFYNLHEGGRGGDTGFNVSMSDVVKSVWDNYTPEEKKSRIGNFGRNYDKSGKNNPMYGKSAVTKNRLRWYTNGEKAIYVTEGTEPEGFVRGRKIKIK